LRQKLIRSEHTRPHSAKAALARIAESAGGTILLPIDDTQAQSKEDDALMSSVNDCLDNVFKNPYLT
jgi:hypothetical protein